jgi:hypothetical protein
MGSHLKSSTSAKKNAWSLQSIILKKWILIPSHFVMDKWIQNVEVYFEESWQSVDK